MKPLALAVLIALTGAPGIAAAQDTSAGGHDAHMQHSSVADDPATAAYQAANARMHEDMAIDFTGDPDIDFMLAMIPHHQGAIDMAEVALEHATDPEVLALAEEVIATQNAEIEMMRAWLAERGQ